MFRDEDDTVRLQELFDAETNAALLGKTVLKVEEVAAAVEIHKANGRLLNRIVSYFSADVHPFCVDVDAKSSFIRV